MNHWLLRLTLITLCALFPALTWAQDAPTPKETSATKATAAKKKPAAQADEEEDLDNLDELDELDENLLKEESMVNPITVKYTPKEIAKQGGSVQIIGEEELEAFEYDDPHDVVTQATGVYVRAEDGFGLRPNIGIRGANSERSKKITLMEDGILFAPAPYSAPAAYYFPLITRMTQVEVFKGPGAILFGPNTIGGAINFITRDPTPKASGGFDAAVGNFPSAKVHAWQSIGNYRSGVILEGVHLYSDGFKTIDFSDRDTGFNRSEVMLKTFVSSDPDKEVFHRVQLKATYSRERSDETYLGLTDADFAADPNRRYTASELDEMTWWRLAFALSHKMEIGESFELTTTAYRHIMERSWKKFNAFEGQSASSILENPNSTRNRVYYDVIRGAADSESDEERIILGTNARDFLSQGVQTIARHRHQAKSWSNQLEVGVRFHADQIERNHTEETYLMRSRKLVRDESEETVDALQNFDQAKALAIHVADQLSFWRLTLTPGARMEAVWTERATETGGSENDGEQQNTTFIPGLGAFFDLTDHLGLLAGAHRGFSPVAPGQAEGVVPETSINYEAGLRYNRPESQSRLELIGFFNDYQDFLGQCTISSGCVRENIDEQFNAGQVYIWGLEALIQHSFDLPGAQSLPVRAAYTLTQSEFQSGFTSSNPPFAEVEEGDALPYVPEHQISAQIGYMHPRIKANVGLTYTAPMREEASQGDEGRTTDAAFLVDALVGYTFFDTGQIYLKADNILNTTAIASRRPFGARPIRPFMAQLGLKYEWE